MKHYTTILFDLDGTLTDPGLGITNSVAHALARLGRAVPPREQLYRYIGPPLIHSFREYAGLTEAEARQAVTLYREYFAPTGIFENAVYEGIPALLRDLRAAGKDVVLATSKPEQFAVQILEHFELAPFFTAVAGASMDETRTAKGDVIALALQRCGAGPDTALMVGDREHDVLGAAANGLRCVGVGYGYGSREELLNAGAAAYAETVAQLLEILL